MEKGFNDQELSDIMSEIENLEKEFAKEPEEAKAAPEASHDEEVEGIDHTEPEVLRELAHKPLEESVPTKVHHHEEKVVHMSKPVAPKQHSDAPVPVKLNFQVAGQMNLLLGFEVNGQHLSLSVSEEAFVIELESGATFSLPIAPSKAAKKAA